MLKMNELSVLAIIKTMDMKGTTSVSGPDRPMWIFD